MIVAAVRPRHGTKSPWLSQVMVISVAQATTEPTRSIADSLRRPNSSSRGMRTWTTIAHVTRATTAVKSRSDQRGPTRAR